VLADADRRNAELRMLNLAMLLVALLGASVGSFLNVVIYRLPRGESLVSPGSRCPGCAVAIAPYDNVPLASWLLLRGRCRSCAEPISVRYPLVEGLTALAFVAVALARGLTLDLALLLPFTALLIAVAGIDLEHRIVPNRIVLPAAIYGLLGSALLRPEQVPELMIAGAAAFAALLLAALAYPGGMGMGDVKLAGVMGLYLGVAVAPALLAAFLGGSAVGLALMARHGGAARKRALPFAPFLALGGLVGVIVGPELVELYASRFL
jgi:leader peptidase (prepilin peptidase)/N-methyltransferase